MSSSEPVGPPAKMSPVMLILFAIGALGVAGLVAGVVIPTLAVLRSGGRPSGTAGLDVGQPLPVLTVAGWLNGSPPDLAGKIVVVEAWAHWCGPCRGRAPHIAELYRKYHDRGVEFVGLTGDGADQLKQIQGFLTEYEISFPNGYGADDLLEDMKVVGIPTAWVIGPNGKVVWNEDSGTELEQGIEQALAQVH